ncbi:M3 family metallopeptidase [Metabacillus sp. cB07]|uniref:M3 family metallopeptidase n=1 Tax=Metabacillus sp. cB07 TaxID=2806989 RepID=UPI001F5E0E1E|nr:M3 family metallopeptidase [Metabacillus sp. cB07]
MKTADYKTRWNLDTLLTGSDLEKVSQYAGNIEETVSFLESASKSDGINENTLSDFSNSIRQIESLESFYYCLTTEKGESSLLADVYSRISALKTRLLHIRFNLAENLFNEDRQEKGVLPIRMTEKDILIGQLRSNKINRKEDKNTRLSKEKLRGLQYDYEQLRNQLNISIHAGDGEKTFTYGEASYMAMSHSDLKVKTNAFKSLNKTLEKQRERFAAIYGQMAEIKLNEYRVKDIHFFDHSLEQNGISKHSLEAMWAAVDECSAELSEYLLVKAEEANKEKLTWHEAMTSTQDVHLEFSVSDAVDAISKSLERIDGEIPEFIHHVITNGWVDLEQRKEKPPGGFCAPFLAEGESRISLSFDNSLESARRLSHELGHAWHFKQMRAVPSLHFSDETFEMTAAETASILFETALIDYVIENTKDNRTKKAILGWKIERQLNYLMSIRGAFLFEKSFYELNKTKDIDAAKMEQLSLQCQKKAFGGALSEYEPYVWIKYGQFYQADVPFYNYPYTFGFLLSAGLLEKSKIDEDFDGKFLKFLGETGTLPLEQLVKKHFAIDLTESDFWIRPLKNMIKDIDQYKELPVHSK